MIIHLPFAKFVRMKTDTFNLCCIKMFEAIMCLKKCLDQMICFIIAQVSFVSSGTEFVTPDSNIQKLGATFNVVLVENN